MQGREKCCSKFQVCPKDKLYLLLFLNCFLSERVIMLCSTGVGKEYRLQDTCLMTYGAEHCSSYPGKQSRVCLLLNTYRNAVLNRACHTVFWEITIIKPEKFLKQVTASSLPGCLLLTFCVYSQTSFRLTFRFVVFLYESVS